VSSRTDHCLCTSAAPKGTADWDEGKLVWWLKFRLPNLTVGSTPAAEVRPSKTAGHGLFTTIEISAGALVSRVGGRLVGSAELDALLAQPEYVNTISVANGLHLVLPPRCPNGYGNHSSDPNLWWDGPYDLIARRPIRAGEELTNEYATSTAVDGFTMTCECCTSVCRGLVCGDDWMRSDLQARYDGHCVPLLLAGSRSVGRGPHDDRHPVSRLGTLEGGEGACSRRRNSPG
jgi:hypothetical protein